MKLHHLPNVLTVFRLCLALPVAWCIVNHQSDLAVGLFFMAAVSDGLDGFLARRYNWQSHLGSILDPVADKLLLMVTFIALSAIGVLPLWLTVLVIGRDLTIVCGALLYRWRVGPYQFKPSWLGKISTLIQLGLVLAALIRQALDIHQPFIVLLPLAVLFTVASGFQYVFEWGAKWWHARSPRD